MDSHFVNFNFSPQEETDLTNAFNVILGIIRPKCINLTTEQRLLPHAANDRKPSVHKAIDYAIADSRLVPPNMTVADVQTDVKLDHQIAPFVEQGGIIKELLTDTQIGAQIDMWNFFLQVYKLAKTFDELGVPGMGAVVKDLGKIFEGQGPNKPIPPTV